MSDKDFSTEHLNDDEKKIANIVIRAVKKINKRDPDGGGCKAFYTQDEWKDRGEDYATDAKLILVHDGGDLSRLCNYSYCDYDGIERFRKALEKADLHIEQCTSWYSAIY